MRLFSRFKKNKNKKLKHILKVKQENNKIKVEGSFSKDSYRASELWLFSREQKKGFKVDEHSLTNNFNFSVSLDELIDKLKSQPEELYDWYFKVTVPFSELSEKRKVDKNLILSESDGVQYAEYFIRCGRFQFTEITGLSFYSKCKNELIIYLSTKGNISLAMNREPNSPIRIQIDKLISSRHILTIKGKLFTRNSLIENGNVILRGRDTNQELKTANIEFNYLKEDVRKRFGLNRYSYTANIDLSIVNNNNLLSEDIYDVYLKLNLHDSRDEKYIRVGRPTFRARYFLKDLYVEKDIETNIINPYFTFKKSNLSLEVYKFPQKTYQYLRRMMRWSFMIRLLNKRKNVWLVGERVYSAQDTGYAFFKYLRNKYPEKEVYYVIDKNSPHRERVEKVGNVLEYKSKRHILYTIIAKKVISSHHPDYLYPIRTSTFKKKVKADKVFLQHGIMGTKNMVANYGKNAHGFETDFFMVSSEFEKQMIVNDFGYDPQNVFVTGLSRFDTLFKNDVVKKRQILIIPTWRDWIVTDDVFFESEYYDRYKNLINNYELHNLSVKYNFEIVFCLHPNMQKFSRYFQNDVVKIINQGEVDVQHLIKESLLMITDYSSVGFDFSFLEKPVIYYQFDRSRFIGNRPSHLDLDNELPGPISGEEDEIVRLVEKYALNNFEMHKSYKNRSAKFIKHKDLKSSARIYSVIRNNKVRRSIFDNSKISLLVNEIYIRYRRSKYYFPSMKLFLTVGSKIIPVDKKLILFESGVGKQYADSPKFIYEEILQQNLDYRKVWVFNKPHRFSDPSTIQIKRLSPKYYYYLLKSGYWVNNQNFPTYIRKRPGTTFLQTWHGTPLKKMLFDIKEVKGRSDDYVERVGEAVKNWDYLISPSQYATKAFKSAFNFKNKILEIGYPRNDIFYKDKKYEIVSNVRKKLRIDSKKKIILYAPTFRDDEVSSSNKFLFNLKLDLHKMKQELGEEYVLLLRMHVVIGNKINIGKDLEGFVHNVSTYSDIQDLLLITDILITDYSSVMFDYANTGRPIIFFTYDLENYRDNLRGFYMDFEKEAPGPLVYNTDEVIKKIKNIEEVSDVYQPKYNEFQKKYCYLEDGYASKRVVDRVFK